jgi:hypothetical protein
MDLPTSHSARFKQGRPLCTTSPLLGREGLFWHAHKPWLRATVYGPIVILPKGHVPYPFPHPSKKFPSFLVIQDYLPRKKKKKKKKKKKVTYELFLHLQENGAIFS